jgi:hypothetical protein
MIPLSVEQIEAAMSPRASGVHARSSLLVDGPAVTAGCECGPACEMPCWQRIGTDPEPGCCCAARRRASEALAALQQELARRSDIMLGAYWRWKLFPAKPEMGERHQKASRALRVGIIAARRAGLDDVALGEALRMPAPAAAQWADLLVRIADSAQEQEGGA